jgi:predicted amidohydrolase
MGRGGLWCSPTRRTVHRLITGVELAQNGHTGAQHAQPVVRMGGEAWREVGLRSPRKHWPSAERPAMEGGTAMRAPSDAPPRKVVIGTCLYNMWHEYPGPDARLARLAEFVDEMGACAQAEHEANLDLAVLPEDAVTGETQGDPAGHSFPLEGKVLDIMGAAARKHRTYLIVPMTLAEDPEHAIYSNAGVLLDRQGSVVGIYRKVHLAAGGDQPRDLEGGLTPGKDYPVFRCDFGKLGIQICMDIYFDEGWETLARKGAEIVAFPSQMASTIRPRRFALQNGYFIVSSTWADNASLFDPTGDLIAQTTRPAGVLVEQIDLSYALVGWQPRLQNGELFTDTYGEKVGFRYSEAEAGGILWSNDPAVPIMQMVRELGLELLSENVEGSRRLNDKIRGGPPSRD